MKIIRLSRSVNISSSVSGASLTTVTTTGVHGMLSGDLVSFPGAIGRFVATVTSTTEFTVPNIPTTEGLTNIYLPNQQVNIEEFRSVYSSVPITLGSDNNNTLTYQVIGATTSGTGTGVGVIEVSNNSINWLVHSTVTLTLGTSNVSDGEAMAASWGFIRFRVTSISGTNAKMTVLIGKN